MVALRDKHLFGQLGLVYCGVGNFIEGGIFLAQRTGIQEHGKNESHQSQNHGNERATERQAATNTNGNDENLQGRESQSHGRLFANRRSNPSVYCVVLGIAIDR